MITDDGKEIISKYLLGYVPSYASHIAIGCGARPRASMENTVDTSEIVNYFAKIVTDNEHFFKVGDWVLISGVSSQYNGYFEVKSIPTAKSFTYKVSTANLAQQSASGTVSPYLNNKKNLNFEVARVPIVSKGFIDDNGVTKISLIGELPSENRYEITEVGLWSSGNNPLSINSDSHLIFSFTESWQGHGASVFDPEIQSSIGENGNISNNLPKVFYALSSDPVLNNTSRRDRAEGHRFLSRSLFISGNSCALNKVNDRLVPASPTTGVDPIHAHLNNVNFDISSNSPSDLLSLAFCLVDRNGVGDPLPSKVKILIEFYKNETTTKNGFAKKEIEINGSEFADNRYRCETFRISELITASDFSSKQIRVCRIFASVETESGLSSNHYISFDGFRIDNVSTENPTYKLSGYSIVQDPNEYPITKIENTINYIEFRFNLGVV